MREELKKRDGVRGEFTAEFRRYGWQRGYHSVRTALFVDIRDKRGSLVSDHQWIVVRRQIADLALKPYERVRFMASPAPYRKGRIDHEQVDYRLKNYSNMERVGHEAQPELPLFPAQAAQ